MKILDLNQAGQAVSGQQFPGAEITAVAWLDFDNWYAKNTEHFDVIVAGHVLQLIERRIVKDFITVLKGLVNDMGEIHLYVTDLDWAAKGILDFQANPMIHFVLYGNEQYPHRTGFTLIWLRKLVESCDIIVRHSTQSAFNINVGEDTVVIPQNVIIGVRNDALFDPATAID